MECLRSELDYLQSQAISASSRKTYLHGQTIYFDFCGKFKLTPYPLSEYNLRLFATFLSRSLSYATISTYLSSLRLQHIELGFRPTPEMPLLRLLLKGIKRHKGAHSHPKRKPITLPLLKALKSALRLSSFSAHDQVMLWAAFTTAFFGFLRASEFCSAYQSTFNPTTTLLVRDVALSSDVAVLSIKASKADQFRRGCEVRLAKSGKSVCPFRSLHRHLSQCNDRNRPLFQFSYGRYLTRQIFSDIVKSLLPSSCDKSEYSSHSFRIGAATAAADKHAPAWLIKALGRWSSNCYEQYIRVNTKQIDKVSALIA